MTQDDRRATYLALAELSRRWAAVEAAPQEPSAALAGAELRVFSQNGEDGVLCEIFRRIGVPPQGTFVEFGVEDGREGNCVFLADVLGWRGLFMEADPHLHHQLHLKYRWPSTVLTLHATVTPERVEELFGMASVPAEPDVVSIDVDGADLWIWAALERYRPRVVVIEYNSALDPAGRQVQPRDQVEGWAGTDFYGASLGALEELGRRKGYVLVHAEIAGVNAFFVRQDLARAFGGAEAVTRRGTNFWLASQSHPPDASGRRYDTF